MFCHKNVLNTFPHAMLNEDILSALESCILCMSFAVLTFHMYVLKSFHYVCSVIKSFMLQPTAVYLLSLRRVEITPWFNDTTMSYMYFTDNTMVTV